MSAHTPGPWVYGDWIRRKEGEYDGAGWVEVWSQADPDNCLPIIACKHGNEMANARLVASAPNLLNALAAIVGALEATGECHRLAAIGRAAIAKATGEQP